ncbi:MAG TPA: chromate transporter [Candidatus Nitrosocosmicus sp.]|nr:chromate transporter [Candidatus Nitrosocosmicus sp.]
MLIDIFFTFFKIGSFTIGGGYAMLPVIQREVVENKGWLKDEEFLDSIAVTNSLPGPLAINCATFVGYKKAGFAGAFSAALGAVMPSFLIILIIALFFGRIQENPYVEYVFAGIRPAVVALIVYALVKLVKSMGINSVNITISIAVLLAILLLDLHPIVTIVTCGILGFFLNRKEEKA